ncbi:hypothetical protein L596_020684 [Steinernema carpocapsae]|uniref:TIL domain-containing protein n=1 Tax=Steinernema carpocapsae TaxID=34508 RepID=A0A4U5MUH3_STECR|nr:hypothetical protein L596_020684 [Steinernema carpocapsae]
MDSKLFFLLCLATVSLAWITPGNKCGPRAVYRKYGTCVTTCEKPEVTVCDRPRRDPGCYCKKPYVFHRGLCILATECPKNATVPTQKPPKCGPNATYLKLGTCTLTCEDPEDTFCGRMRRDPGCYCNKSYVLHRGQCILATECPKDMHVDPLMRQ